jgi:hypothetical protein
LKVNEATGLAAGMLYRKGAKSARVRKERLDEWVVRLEMNNRFGHLYSVFSLRSLAFFAPLR